MRQEIFWKPLKLCLFGTRLSHILVILPFTLLILWMAFPVYSYETTNSPKIGRDLAEMSIEELMNIQVTIVSKKPEKYLDTPAAIFVITSEDIRRSGVTSIPEALRLAPGVEVSRLNNSRWTVGIRGFGSAFNRYMLVLIDGRSVYLPLFAGVDWGTQDYPLEDIDHIEIIRGPGGSLWGANAVNGIVNIITKSAKDTQGGMVTFGGGTEDRLFGSVRYGGETAGDTGYRIYGKYFDRDSLYHEDGNNYEAWQMGQVGFRADGSTSEQNKFTLQGDLYQSTPGFKVGIINYSSPSYTESLIEDSRYTGANLLGRWSHKVSDTSDWTFQVYYDKVKRSDPHCGLDQDTIDFDFQHKFRLTSRQHVTWGIGYRFISFDLSSLAPTYIWTKPNHNDSLFSAFVEDEIYLVQDKLKLILGSKFVHNDYSGFEYQPSGKILWKPALKQSVWASISRAVRTPSPLEHEFQSTGFLSSTPIPIYYRTNPFNDDKFETEKLIAYELGYRIQPHQKIFFDVAAFYNVYDNYLSAEFDFGAAFLEMSPSPHMIVPVYLRNKLSGKVYGGEIAVDYNLFDWWHLHIVQSILHIDMQKDADSLDTFSVESIESSSPTHQTSIRSYMELPGRLKLDCIFRYVADLPYLKINSYYNMDVRLSWQAVKNLELSIVGQNLLDKEHPEYSNMSEVQRGVYLKGIWKW